MASPSATADIVTLYTERRDARRATVARRDQWHARLSYLRLSVALLGFATLWLLGVDGWRWVAAIAGVFVALVIVHARITEARDRAGAAVAFYERGLTRLRHEWPGRGDGGERFSPANHLYVDDLDVFGHGSLFELLATCRTEVGKATLAWWLCAPATPEDVRARQDAVRALAPQLDLREQMAVEGEWVGTRVHAGPLRAWALTPREMPAGLAELVLRSTPLLLCGAIVWRSWGGPAGLSETMLIVQVIVAWLLRPRVLRVIHAVDSPARDLELLVRLSRLIEQIRVTAPRLVALQRALTDGGTTASASIGHLARLVALLASRRNVMFAPVAGLLMWATQLAFSIEAWRARHGHAVPRWLETVGEFDALSALAAFSAEHPGHVFPDVAPAGDAQITARGLAHPLLPDTAVANDVAMGAGAPRLWLVSGSNMSGKSTLLRAVGLTIVLAQAGAPVRATECRLSPLAIGASIRVLDSLQDGHSRFYAEIVRLKHLVDLARVSGGQMIFLLDEVLSGTNSHDRRQGAEGLLRGLVRLGAIGLTTTHDLALGEIADALHETAINVHFSDVFENGSLAFDYVLRPGPVRTSNALALMRSVGLEVGDA